MGASDRPKRVASRRSARAKTGNVKVPYQQIWVKGVLSGYASDLFRPLLGLHLAVCYGVPEQYYVPKGFPTRDCVRVRLCYTIEDLVRILKHEIVPSLVKKGMMRPVPVSSNQPHAWRAWWRDMADRLPVDKDRPQGKFAWDETDSKSMALLAHLKSLRFYRDFENKAALLRGEPGGGKRGSSSRPAASGAAAAAAAGGPVKQEEVVEVEQQAEEQGGNERKMGSREDGEEEEEDDDDGWWGDESGEERTREGQQRGEEEEASTDEEMVDDRRVILPIAHPRRRQQQQQAEAAGGRAGEEDKAMGMEEQQPPPPRGRWLQEEAGMSASAASRTVQAFVTPEKQEGERDRQQQEKGAEEEAAAGGARQAATVGQASAGAASGDAGGPAAPVPEAYKQQVLASLLRLPSSQHKLMAIRALTKCPGRSLLLESLHLAVDLQSAATQASTLLLALASGGWLDGGYKEQVLTAVLARPAGEGRSRALQKLAQQPPGHLPLPLLLDECLLAQPGRPDVAAQEAADLLLSLAHEGFL